MQEELLLRILHKLNLLLPEGERIPLPTDNGLRGALVDSSLLDQSKLEGITEQ